VWLVVAYGNPLRRDDGVAWRVAGELEGGRDIEVTYEHQLVPELAARVGRAEGVLFLDAAVGSTPGRVTVHEVAPQPEESAFGHVLRPSGMLDLARRLCGQAPPAVLLTVTVRDVAFGMELSAEVEASLEAATRAARSALARLAARKPCGETPPKP
jgi:hydrogenase maturation protease